MPFSMTGQQIVLELTALLVFPSLMAFAAATDLLTMTISNRISIALLLGFAALAACAGLPASLIAYDLSCGVAILVVTFSLFALGVIGGGDAKLAATTAVWLGWSNILDYGLTASLIGGVLTLAIVWLRRHALPPWLMAYGWVARIHNPTSGVPYGLALAAAGLIVYPQTQLWQTASLG